VGTDWVELFAVFLVASVPVSFVAMLTARRLMRLVMRQRMMELIYAERLALMRRGLEQHAPTASE